MVEAPQIILPGIGGAIVAILAAFIMFLPGVRAWRRDRRQDQRDETRDEQSDTASLLNSQRIALDGAFKREESLRRRLDAQDRRIAELTEQLDVERRQRAEEHSYYEGRVAELAGQLADVMRQLDELRDQLHPEGDDA